MARAAGSRNGRGQVLYAGKEGESSLPMETFRAQPTDSLEGAIATNPYLIVMFRQISLGSIGLAVGGSLTLMGIITYFLSINPTLDLIGLFYGTPILLGGFALKAAELKPTPFSQPTPPEILALRERQATPTLNQIRKDVTRYRYGQEVHLDESLQRFGLSPTDEERPILRAIREADIEECYALILEFESPFMPLEKWQQQQEKIAKFFGPGIRVELNQPKRDWIEAALIVIRSS